MSKLPFEAGIFVKVLAVVVVLAIVAWVVAKRLFDYGPLQPQDWVGTVITTLLLSYLVHLWLLPMDDHHSDGDPPDDSPDLS